jgi:hypothetical protein
MSMNTRTFALRGWRENASISKSTTFSNLEDRGFKSLLLHSLVSWFLDRAENRSKKPHTSELTRIATLPLLIVQNRSERLSHFAQCSLH